MRRMARIALAGGSKVYTYSFEASVKNEVQTFSFGKLIPGVASHAVEVPFVFSDHEELQLFAGEEADLAKQVANHWVEFGKKGDPNAQGENVWPQYMAESDMVLRFRVASQGGVKEEQNFRKAACDYWDSLSGPPASEMETLGGFEATDMSKQWQ